MLQRLALSLVMARTAALELYSVGIIAFMSLLLSFLSFDALCRSLAIRSAHSGTQSSILIQQIVQIVIIPSSPSPLHHNFLLCALFLLLCHRAQNILQLILTNSRAKLTAARKHYQAILNVLRSRCVDHANAPETIGG
jgi:hypothetical protein